MASLERRLRQLETYAETLRQENNAAVSQEVMRRLTDEELEAYEEALRRALQSGEYAEEDQPILGRVEELYEEIRAEY